MTDHYVPGTCNIGPEEVALRRRARQIATTTSAAIGLGVALVAVAAG
jgi:hypothetical protein